MTLHTQLALIGCAIILIGLPVLAWDWLRSRRERRAAYRIAQAEKISVPHPTLQLYRNLNRMGGHRK